MYTLREGLNKFLSSRYLFMCLVHGKGMLSANP